MSAARRTTVTQTQIGTRAVTDFPLCDQEILLRHLHHTAHKYVDRYKASLNGNGSSADHAAAGHEAPTKDEVNA